MNTQATLELDQEIAAIVEVVVKRTVSFMREELGVAPHRRQASWRPAGVAAVARRHRDRRRRLPVGALHSLQLRTTA